MEADPVTWVASCPLVFAMLLASVLLPCMGIAEDIYIDSAADSTGDGTEVFPFVSIHKTVIRSGNRYLFRRDRVYDGDIDIAGVRDVELGAWGFGLPPLIKGVAGAGNGIRLVSSARVSVVGLELSNLDGACILVVGSVDYRIQDNHCHDARFGVVVNAGKMGPEGLIYGNRIHRVSGDGIGTWNLTAGIIIKNNHVYDFGNDGIDILGSSGVIVEGNTVHDSIDRPEMDRGMSHTGIKAGGNRGAGGGNNIVSGNTVYRVKNFGIWNRGAVANIYRGNTCYDNGVNFNFVNPSVPSLATIEGNLARDPSFAAGLRYSVFIPVAADLRGAANNLWLGGLVNVKDRGVIGDEASYRALMQPLERGTRFRPDPDEVADWPANHRDAGTRQPSGLH
jgi:parallel beta-helix repeat protein